MLPVPATRSHTWPILFALWLMMFSTSSQLIIMIPILPEIAATLHISEGLQGILLGSFGVALGFSAVISGPISDHIGRRRILLIGTACMTVALVLHTVAASYTLLLAMRVLAGLAGGILSGGSVAYVGDYFPYERRGWANGWIMSGTAFGQVAGVPIGKLLANAYGYRWPFLVFAITMGVATVLIWRVVPQADVPREEDTLSIRRAARRYRRLMQSRPVRAAVATYFLMFLGIGLFTAFLPTWLEHEVGVSGQQIALLFGIGGTANILASPIAGRASDATGRKPLIIGSCLGLGAIVVASTYVIDGFYMAAVLFFFAMVTVGMRVSPLQSLLTALAPAERRGLLMGIAIGIGQAAFGLGSFIAGLTYTPYGYVSNTLLGAAATILMAFVVWQGLPEPKRVHALNNDASGST